MLLTFLSVVFIADPSTELPAVALFIFLLFSNMGDLLEDGAVQCSKDLVEVVDSNGAVLRVKRYRGKNFTPCVVGNVKDHLEQVANMEVRPDDVFITTFPKSGKELCITVLGAELSHVGILPLLSIKHILDGYY